MLEDFPILLDKIHKKGAKPEKPTQNLQIMRAEPREEDYMVNILLWSGATTSEDKGK